MIFKYDREPACRKTADGVYLMIQSGKGVNIGTLMFSMYYVTVTLRNDGYIAAGAANISIQLDDNGRVNWNNESIPPGETRTGSATLEENQFTLTVFYDNVPQDSGNYFIP